MKDIETLKKLLEEITGLFTEFLPLEQEKLKAAQDEDPALLEECINKEQAFSLKLRGLEQKREKLLSDNGWTGMTLREIIRELPEEHKNPLMASFDRMRMAVREFKSANDSAMKIVDINLRNIENKLGSTSYGNNGEAERKVTGRTIARI